MHYYGGKMKRKYHLNFLRPASFHQRYFHINFYTKWLAFFTSLTSHESKSSLESAVHESKSSPKSLFMWLKCDSSSSRRLEFPSLERGNHYQPKSHHQTPMTCKYGFSHFRHFQNCCNRDGKTILNTWILFPSLLPQFWKCPFLF